MLHRHQIKLSNKSNGNYCVGALDMVKITPNKAYYNTVQNYPKHYELNYNKIVTRTNLAVLFFSSSSKHQHHPCRWNSMLPECLR
jgi:hypothetical protein